MPSNFAGGVSTRPAHHIFGSFPRPDPTEVWSFFDDFNGFVTSAAGVTGWHLDELNTGTGPTMLDEFGGVVQFEPDNAQFDYFHYQLALNTTVYEPVKLIAGKKAWFSTCFSVEDVDQNDALIGAHNATDDIFTTNNPSDKFAVRLTGGTGQLQFVFGKTIGGEVAANLGAMVDSARYAVYGYYDGAHVVAIEAYTLNPATGVMTPFGRARLSASSSAAAAGDLLPDTEMTLAFGMRARDTGTDKLQIDWLHLARER